MKWPLLILWFAAVGYFYNGELNAALANCSGGTDLTDSPCFFSRIFITSFALVLIIPAISACIWGKVFRLLVLTVLAYASLWYAQDRAFSIVTDIRTFGYEKFVVLFYIWAVLVFLSEVVILLLPKFTRFILLLLAVVTAIFSILFALYGRGSIEHFVHLVGGVFSEISWAAVAAGGLLQLCLVIMALATIVMIAVNTTLWIRNGNADYKEILRVIKSTILVLVISLISLISIPPGVWLGERDVTEAKDFLNKLVPELQDFLHANDNAYPPTLISTVLEPEAEQPRLLSIFDFLAYGSQGGYYVSRPNKYCFLIYNPVAMDYGYYSMTSERGWKFHPYRGRSLELIFAELCDDPGSFRQRITKHLGLEADPNDPKTILEPSSIYKNQWEPPAVDNFPEFLPTEEQEELQKRRDFPYLYRDK